MEFPDRWICNFGGNEYTIIKPTDYLFTKVTLDYNFILKNDDVQIINLLNMGIHQLKKSANVDKQYVGRIQINEALHSWSSMSIEIGIRAIISPVDKIIHDTNFHNKLEDLINAD